MLSKIHGFHQIIIRKVVRQVTETTTEMIGTCKLSRIYAIVKVDTHARWYISSVANVT